MRSKIELAQKGRVGRETGSDRDPASLNTPGENDAVTDVQKRNEQCTSEAIWK